MEDKVLGTIDAMIPTLTKEWNRSRSNTMVTTHAITGARGTSNQARANPAFVMTATTARNVTKTTPAVMIKSMDHHLAGAKGIIRFLHHRA